jgi:peptidyl-prolyl cis-trans isomerase B (cyclophilin B)
VAGNTKRERQLAREHYLRQQARRAEATARRRRMQQVTAAVLAVLLVIGGVVALTAVLGDGKAKTTPAAQPSASTTPSVTPSAAAAACAYGKSPQKASKDVGVPTYDKAKAKEPFTATLTTNKGPIVIDMATTKAPCTTNSFKFLATKDYFDKTSCHRLTSGGIFVLQCGDPTASGNGGPGYQFGIENAPADGRYPAGTIAMARTDDPNSNGSQFFVVYQDSQLPTKGGGYSVFGTVTKGLDLVKKIAAGGVAGGGSDGKPAQQVVIQSVEIGKA